MLIPTVEQNAHVLPFEQKKEKRWLSKVQINRLWLSLKSQQFCHWMNLPEDAIVKTGHHQWKAVSNNQLLSKFGYKAKF